MHSKKYIRYPILKFNNKAIYNFKKSHNAKGRFWEFLSIFLRHELWAIATGYRKHAHYKLSANHFNHHNEFALTLKMPKKNKQKIPPNWFQAPEVAAFIWLPVTWVLLPMSGFCPEALQPYLLPSIFSGILLIQVRYNLIISKNFSEFVVFIQGVCKTVFIAILVIHCFELMACLFLCNKIGLDSGTTFKWFINVTFNGFFALKMLLSPENYFKGGRAK